MVLGHDCDEVEELDFVWSRFNAVFAALSSVSLVTSGNHLADHISAAGILSPTRLQ